MSSRNEHCSAATAGDSVAKFAPNSRGGATKRKFATGLLFIFLTLGNAGIAAAAAQCAGPQLNQQARPISLGVAVTNAVWVPFKQDCFVSFGSPAALVADSSGNQYILGAAHVFALGLTGYFASGSGQAITQPEPEPPSPPPACSVTPAQVSSVQVASLSTVIQPNFSAHATTPADAALAQVLPGEVSSAILNIPVFSSTPLAVVKKGLQVQKEGACTGLTPGHVITKMLIPKRFRICTSAQPLKLDINGKIICKNSNVETIPNNFEVEPADFGEEGDSGALVTTVGTCPQPVGMLGGGNTVGTAAVVTAIPKVLQALQSAGSFSGLSIVAGGGGCTPSTSQIQVPGGSSADFTLQDATIADPDVAQALTVLPDFTSYVEILILDGVVDGVGIDLSGSTAALDVVWDSQAYEDDATIPPIPSSYEGVPVEQHIIETVDLTSALMSASN